MQLEESRQTLTISKNSQKPQWWRGLVGPAIAVLIFFLSLYFLSGAYFTKGISDGDVMAQTAVALARNHSVELPPNPGLPQIVAGKNNQYFSKYGLGQPLLAAALYKVGGYFARFTMPQADSNIIGHFFIMLLPVLATALTVWLVFLWGRALYNSIPVGLGLALLYGLGTAAWPYSRYFFSEPLFTLCTFGAAYALWQAKHTPKISARSRYCWLALSGLLLGYSLMTKISGLVLFPAYLFYLFTLLDSQLSLPDFRNFSFLTHSSKLKTQNFLSFLAGLVPALLIILLHNYIRFGSPFNNGYDGEAFSTPIWKGLTGLLFSPGKSIFVYSPVLLALPFAVTAFGGRFKFEAILIGMISLITLLYYSVWWAWEGGWCWGPRFLVPLLPFLVLPLGVLFQKSRVWTGILFMILLPLGIIVQMLGVAIDFNTYMSVVGNNPDAYVWNPADSPILKHWQQFGYGAYNQIRALTLDQLGFKRNIGLILSSLIIFLLVASGTMLCVKYLLEKRKTRQVQP